jgi:diguanylate cyclase (GGDEF)-like protein/putative nucleotidyltransferase with HDIG domain
VFGTDPQRRRPVLLLIVYGVFLAVVGITAAAQAVLVSAHFQAGALNDIVSSDSATIRAFVNANLQPHHLEAGTTGGASADELATLERRLATLLRPGEILRVELRRPDGTIVAADDPALRGAVVVPTDDFAAAAAGRSRATMVPVERADAGPVPIAAPTVLREYLPIASDGRVVAVVGIWRDGQPILARLAGARQDVVLMTLSAGFIAAALLFLVFRSAQGRLTRQTAALVETARLDPLTGTLNHGALVGHLAGAIEEARTSGSPLGVALVDLDNFRLLNDHHGHRAGDEALLAVVDLLWAELPDGVVAGRYGPDEFLLVAPTAAVAELEPAIGRLRAGLVDLSLQFGASERLPVTVSAGLCTYPEHGTSVTALLAATARTLESAKASGGDRVIVAGSEQSGEAETSGFDVLQGLVLAVDTKDRYTKRHSEDVARYAVFLAELLGLDAETIRTIRTAGLLHDVGKIGIPDPILRKPGKLTEAEQEIVKQHVALGDMIVRDLPDIEVVRAGIRHHHERWDGQGYLDRLAGDSIPLIARILAVGDTFSAMTTTRPYRKALGVREALTRLEDAAGTQLDERLVGAFVGGIESAANPPLPASEGRAGLWTARPRVA